MMAKDAPRVLLVCEFGAGISHVRRMTEVAAHLQALGAECLAALNDPELGAPLRHLGVPVIQSVVWPARRRQPAAWKERQPRGLGDVLANLGVTRPEVLAPAIGHYDALFSLFRPDVVLSENGFGALLAARGRLPAIAFGTPNCLPPTKGDDLAPYDGAAHSPSWPTEQVLSGINAGLSAAGRPLLANMAALLDEASAVMPFGPPELDLFASNRRAPLLSPHLSGISAPMQARADAPEVFIYLHGFLQQRAAVMESLLSIACPSRVFMPGLTEEWRARFPSHIRVATEPVPPARIVAQSRAVLHHGGRQMTALCLATGLPQAILAKESDNVLAARLVTRRGLGVACLLRDLTQDWLAQAADQLHTDAAFGVRARNAAHDFAGWFGQDPTLAVARAALAQCRP